MPSARKAPAIRNPVTSEARMNISNEAALTMAPPTMSHFRPLMSESFPKPILPTIITMPMTPKKTPISIGCIPRFTTASSIKATSKIPMANMLANMATPSAP